MLTGLLYPAARAGAYPPQANLAQSSQVTAFDLIIAMNTLRVSYGLPALVEDPIIDAVAQSTAEIMAANQMSWHIGDVSGRLASAGYGAGSKVWGTENFAVGNLSIDQIMIIWSDASHMIPAVTPAYCNIGAGIAKTADGRTYYILQAAYTSGKSCGDYKSVGGATAQPGGSTNEGRVPGVSQLIVPVKIATPGPDGKIFHVVQAGQSFWSIAIAYKITIQDLETWNNLSRNSQLQMGERLFIPGSNTAGYSTPTPVGMVQLNSPDGGGKIIHTVQPYQTLSTISQAYHVNLDTILRLNGIQVDWPLKIGQKLVINPGNVTPSPTPGPIARLTPASDGKYYHIVRSGETLGWIARYYQISLADLMAWNGLNETSILMPDQKLVMEVTPPASATPTSAPATATQTATTVPPTLTPTLPQTPGVSSSPAPIESSVADSGRSMAWYGLVGLAVAGLGLIVWINRKRNR